MTTLVWMADSRIQCDGREQVREGPQAQDCAEPPLISTVDDERLVLKSLSRLLRAAGFRVVAFESAEEFCRQTKLRGLSASSSTRDSQG